MDKVFSTRLDEDLVHHIHRFAKEKGISKKSLMDRALRMYLHQISETVEYDIVSRAFGAWKRKETAEETHALARQVFNQSFTRHK